MSIFPKWLTDTYSIFDRWTTGFTPGDAYAPTMPFEVGAIGVFRRDPTTQDWIKHEFNPNQIDPERWTPVPNGIANESERNTLDALEREILSRSAAQQNELEDAIKRALPLTWGVGIDPLTNTNYHTTTRSRPLRRDPLALDLDGDGIETVGTTTATGGHILFDHNADGIRTGTGWVKGDDAWLVLDRNNNGLIDSGRELFGVDTLLSGTPGTNAVYASNGFEALRTLDTNNDNLFNVSDAAFAQVKLWQDSNQDGISQASELFTLAQKNIASISLNATTDTTNLGNGNSISGTAVVTRSNGCGWMMRNVKKKVIQRTCHKIFSYRNNSKLYNTIAISGYGIHDHIVTKNRVAINEEIFIGVTK